MNKELDAVSEVKFSEEERSIIRAHMERVLATEPFLHSFRSRSFLSYVVEETLQGKSAQIKERNIAVDIFGKNEDYDPQEESTVRVAAGEVRKRLARTYLAGIGDGVRITLPVGTYTPRITLTPSSTVVVCEPSVVVCEPSPRETRRTSRKLFWMLAIASCAVAIVAGALVYRSQAHEPIDDLWAIFSDSREPVTILIPTPAVQEIGDSDPLASGASNRLVDAAERNTHSGGYTGVGASLGAARFAEQLAKRHQRFNLRLGRDSSLPDIQTGPSILLGGQSSTLGVRMTQALRFRIVSEQSRSSIVDTHDSHSVWSVPRNMPPDAQVEGYTLITLIHKSESRFPVLIVAGLSPADTQAGVQFLTDNNELKMFEAIALQRLGERNIQIVLHENVFQGSPDKPGIVSWSAW